MNIRERTAAHRARQPNAHNKRRTNRGIMWRKQTAHDLYLEEFYRTHTYVDGRWIKNDEEE